MTTADTAQQMTLDRVIDFGEPIHELASNEHVPEVPLLRLRGKRFLVTVHANTGEHYHGEDRAAWYPARNDLAGFALGSGLEARADGKGGPGPHRTGGRVARPERPHHPRHLDHAVPVAR